MTNNKLKPLTDKEFEDFANLVRNQVLEEVAQEFEKMPFGNTSASFAAFVRNMKHESITKI